WSRVRRGRCSMADFFNWLSPSHYGRLPFADWVQWLVRDWLVPNFRPAFQAMQWPGHQVMRGLEAVLLAIPFPVFTLVLVALAWRFAGRGVAIFTLLAMLFIDAIGVWGETMTTLAMILTAVLFCAVVGIPAGIAAARSDRV